MTKNENINRMKTYWDKIFTQMQTSKAISSKNSINQKLTQSKAINILGELYFRNSIELITIFKKLSQKDVEFYFFSFFLNKI